MPEAVAGPAIRTARDEDVPAIRRILAAHDNDGPVVEGGTDVVGPYLAHLLAHHRALVSVDGGDVVAFGAVADAGGIAMLTDLFVAPDRLGRGIGRPLLAALFEGSTDRATFASSDPRALPLYVRAGMSPLWLDLYLEGDVAQLPPADPRLTVRDAGPGEPAALDARWTGRHRPADHAYWASQAVVDAFVVEDAEGPVAAGYARARQVSTTRVVDHTVIRPGADPVGPAVEALRRAARGGRAEACVLGPNPVLPVLLEAGFRISDHDQFLASSPDLVDPARLLPNPGLL